MTGIYRWLGISSGAIHGQWSYHLYALAAVNGLCLILNMIAICVMRRKIASAPGPESPCSSPSMSQSSDSEEDTTGKEKGMSLKVRYDKSSSSQAKISASHRSRRNKERVKESTGDTTCSIPMVVRKTVQPLNHAEHPEEYRPSAPTYKAPRSPVYFS